MSNYEILAIDDEDEICELFKTLLTRAGHTVCTATSAKKAEILLQSYVPPLILCDISMPGKSGLELVAEIREKGLPCAIVMVTAHSEKERILEALQLGCLDYVQKPFHLQTFTDNVKLWIEYGRTAQAIIYEQSDFSQSQNMFMHLDWLRAKCILNHKKKAG